MKLNEKATNPKAIRAFETLPERFLLAHGNIYNYSKFIYTNNNTKSIIICSQHGEFEMTPKNHFHGQGCPVCGGVKKLNTKIFIDRSIEIHGKRYDYSLVNYSNNHSKIKIICTLHGLFEQTPSNHLQGKGCLSCSGRKKNTTEEFISNSKKVHGDKYDYSSSYYSGNKSKLTIICKTHGPFDQIPINHIFHAYGCPSCGGNKKLNTDIFIERSKEIHGEKYDYSLVKYKGRAHKIKIICKEHGLFEQKADAHLIGGGCITCGGNEKLTTESFIKKARHVFGDLYNYSKVNYINNTTSVKIICSEHGEFSKNPNHHLRGQGCQSCASSGFDPNKPAILYYLKVQGGIAYKIGITNNSVKKRFGSDISKVQILKIWKYDIGFHARARESEIIKTFEANLYRGPQILKSGNSELFDIDILFLDEP
jgi:hypothetical protein